MPQEDASDEEKAEAVLGEHEFSGSLFSLEKVEELPGSYPNAPPSAAHVAAYQEKVNQESRKKANEKSWHDHTDHVVTVAVSAEEAHEMSLVGHAAWFHFSVTADEVTDNLGDLDNMERHNGFRLAEELEQFDVSWSADYENGTLSVSVSRA